MKNHRFIGDFSLKIGNLKLRDDELFNQARNVLRLKVGDEIILGDGKLNEARAKIKGYERGVVDVEILAINRNQNESKNHVVLYCSILKKENFELVVQKATEVGISEIVPIITARTVKLDVRKDRLEKIIKEAAEQSGRGVVPILHDPIDFEKAIFGVDKSSINFFFDKSGEVFQHRKSGGFTMLTYKSDPSPNSYKLIPIHIFIGPEGGWNLQEIEAAKIAGFEIISLGKLTFRAETAAIIASYISTT